MILNRLKGMFLLSLILKMQFFQNIHLYASFSSLSINHCEKNSECTCYVFQSCDRYNIYNENMSCSLCYFFLACDRKGWGDFLFSSQNNISLSIKHVQHGDNFSPLLFNFSIILVLHRCIYWLELFLRWAMWPICLLFLFALLNIKYLWSGYEGDGMFMVSRYVNYDLKQNGHGNHKLAIAQITS